MPTVAILAFPAMQSLDITGPMDVFAEANRFLEPVRHYRLSVLGTGPGPVRCSNGLTVQPDLPYEGCEEAFDLLVVPGGPAVPSLPRDNGLSRWLQAAGRRCRRVASVCNGAFLLAHAGLLDGLRVTTHWNDASKLAARFPKVDVNADRIFLRQGNIYTSAGVTAGIDLALHLVFEDHGPEVSLNVAKRLVVFSQRNGGQSQFSPYLTPYSANASVVDTVRDHVRRHIDHDLTVDCLAKHAAMSTRNFARVFAKEAGITPAEFVERCRIDAAKVLLETETLPLKTIAHRCGFSTAMRMRMAFTRHLGVTAQQYRQNFGAFAKGSGAVA
ncbi:GlxA family transcriptional regulator [Pseudoduganella umbonata]|uniref:GlxA family transcriptional regulator n=1 Tax=Pseudoduganella umbonata TaxID=864828 RepID=A0A4P8HMP3_9BURK|nr:GlxA family transcriptional regulator [Pseudoduganella umbonata]MBB3219425.1 transcriptional regulator GlxA family with amidase domain [Pseudoduganella umbonata]QCP09515.1 GlxA family transcriptional regulator [Pseudoduganella umbonata]